MRIGPIGIAAVLVYIASALYSANARAEPIYWNTWASTTAGTLTAPGGPVAVTFSGPAFGFNPSYPSWTPAATFADGSVVDNGPVPSNGIMQLRGGTGALNTVSFATPVVDPVMAILSLGQGGTLATFVFNGATPLLVSGGSNAEFGVPRSSSPTARCQA